MKKIIIIDDDPDIRNMTHEMLEDSYDITELETVDDVVEHCNNHSVDLIITDLFMPDKSGLDLIEIISETNKNIKFLAISGGSRLKKCDFLPIAEIFGACETLQKPFTMRALREKVSAILYNTEKVI